MKITDVPFAVLRFQYRVVRFPLQLIEDRVIARMGGRSSLCAWSRAFAGGCWTRRSVTHSVIGSVRSVALRSPSAAMHWSARRDSSPHPERNTLTTN